MVVFTLQHTTEKENYIYCATADTCKSQILDPIIVDKNKEDDCCIIT